MNARRTLADATPADFATPADVSDALRARVARRVRLHAALIAARALYAADPTPANEAARDAAFLAWVEA